MPERGPVIGVLGGSGGVGASSFAAALAVAGHATFLIDLDGSGGGIDINLGIEDAPGARWSGLQLSGGLLESAVLSDGLPRAGPCAVLAADTPELDAAAVEQVLDVAAASGPVVVDLPRHAGPVRDAALRYLSLVVLLARADVPGLVAAHTALQSLAAAHTAARGLPGTPVGLIVRRGPVAPESCAQLVGAPLLGCLPPLHRGAPIDPDRLPRAAARLAAGVLAGLDLPSGTAR